MKYHGWIEIGAQVNWNFKWWETELNNFWLILLSLWHKNDINILLPAMQEFYESLAKSKFF